jgi:hypothetical protein
VIVHTAVTSLRHTGADGAEEFAFLREPSCRICESSGSVLKMADTRRSSSAASASGGADTMMMTCLEHRDAGAADSLLGEVRHLTEALRESRRELENAKLVRL